MQRTSKEVAKQLLLTVLFSLIKEYQIALEKYFDNYVEHFIESIGVNSWVFLFKEKLLPEVREIVKTINNGLKEF